ncbi:helix-turn-helix transcriptional regulator [Prescottella equi]|uniref:helix-turn-helix transcriptional regulator n=1 Tax=Rhodococcus hoagii TaxID=43767 RepID=UPI000A101AC0|nr:helix-turn-helix transcriptional regulator [Prescottella equi]ORM04541.1 hypothetical protein A5N73_07855 [Prescottella equi]WJJ10840.1 helix-turn-helix transcriptional regulator [Prescottella equi]
MGMFEELEAELGIDVSDTLAMLAAELVRQDRDMIEALIALRVAKNITQAQVAERLGRNKSSVSNFERLGADPHLSTIRRYAVAVGACVRHIVEDADGKHLLQGANGWIAMPSAYRVIDFPATRADELRSASHRQWVVSQLNMGWSGIKRRPPTVHYGNPSDRIIDVHFAASEPIETIEDSCLA